MKNKKPLSAYFLLLGICFFAHSVSGQNTGYYYAYDFDQFLEQCTIDAASYKKEFLSKLYYAAICRENNQEGDVEFLVFHHGDGVFEIIQKKREHRFFEEAVKLAFENTKGQLREGVQEKYLTTIRIRFDLAPFETNQDFKYDFILTAEKVILKEIQSHR